MENQITLLHQEQHNGILYDLYECQAGNETFLGMGKECSELALIKARLLPTQTAINNQYFNWSLTLTNLLAIECLKGDANFLEILSRHLDELTSRKRLAARLIIPANLDMPNYRYELMKWFSTFEGVTYAIGTSPDEGGQRVIYLCRSEKMFHLMRTRDIEEAWEVAISELNQEQEVLAKLGDLQRNLIANRHPDLLIYAFTVSPQHLHSLEAFSFYSKGESVTYFKGFIESCHYIQELFTELERQVLAHLILGFSPHYSFGLALQEKKGA